MVAKKMQNYLEDSEALQVSTRELKGQVLSSDESSVGTVRIVRQARSEKSKKVVSDLQTRSERGPHFQYGEMGGAIDGPDRAGEVLPGGQGGSGTFKRKTRSLGYSDGGQDEHAEGSIGRRQIFHELRELEEQKTKEALELVQRKHKVIKWEGEGRGQEVCQGWSRQGQQDSCP